MKLSVLTVPLQGMAAEEAFSYLSKLGVEQVEIGTGGYTNENHLKPSVYLNDQAKIDAFKAMMERLNLGISALSCHGNPVHPNKELAEGYHNVFVDTCRLAQKLGVDVDNLLISQPDYGEQALEIADRLILCDLLGLPRRLRRVQAPQLGYLCMAQ